MNRKTLTEVVANVVASPAPVAGQAPAAAPVVKSPNEVKLEALRLQIQKDPNNIALINQESALAKMVATEKAAAQAKAKVAAPQKTPQVGAGTVNPTPAAGVSPNTNAPVATS